jgi:hypothetical protein
MNKFSYMSGNALLILITAVPFFPLHVVEIGREDEVK